jgi:hypothetical protein
MTTLALAALALLIPARAPKEPAKDLFLHFEKAPGVEGEGTVVLTLRYGDRRLSLTLTR